MCTVLLPPGGYPIAVNKYIISYDIISTTMANGPLHTFCALGHLLGLDQVLGQFVFGATPLSGPGRPHSRGF